jgi:hypothetical protein
LPGDLELIKIAVLPQVRPGMLEKLPKEWHEEALRADFDWAGCLACKSKARRDSFLTARRSRSMAMPGW